MSAAKRTRLCRSESNEFENHLELIENPNISRPNMVLFLHALRKLSIQKNLDLKKTKKNSLLKCLQHHSVYVFTHKAEQNIIDSYVFYPQDGALSMKDRCVGNFTRSVLHK